MSISVRLCSLALASALIAGTGTAAVAQNAMHPVVQKERISDRNGVLRTTEVLKSGKHLETVTCRDFTMLDEGFKPQAVTYAANYGPKGKAHPTETVSGVERFVPVVVTNCRARPGDKLVNQVHSAMATHKKG
jgi:hypothetical protein